MKKLILFGAGKIGRSFIGQLFARSGWDVVFIDIFEPVINELNIRRKYNVVIKSDKDEILEVTNVRGLLLSQSDEVAHEISTADMVAVSVGQQGLPGAINLIAKGLSRRFFQSPCLPLDIIIAENLRNADVYFKDNLIPQLPDNYPFEKLVGLIETSIGKMVPIMTPADMQHDILQVFAEPYNTLILDKKGFKNPIPDVKGLASKENMKAWVDRKSFIHNLGHAVVSYVGYVHNPKFIYLWEALEVAEIYNFTKDAMRQSADILVAMYPSEFTSKDIDDHIDDLLNRFKNKALGDTIFRVGCDLPRKLSREDRLFGALLQGHQRKLATDKILKAAVFGFFFKATDSQGKMHPADIEFHNKLNKSIDDVLLNICKINHTSELDIIEKAKEYYNLLTKNAKLLDIMKLNALK